jgi:methionine-gamma-lyase
MEKLFSGFGTTAVHAGKNKDGQQAHLTPIYATSTYLFEDAQQAAGRFTGEDPGYIYGRYGSPTITEVEAKISALECFGLQDAAGKPLRARAILHSSGIAAIATLLMSNLVKGDKILSHFSLYGSTQDLVLKVLQPLGVEMIIEDLRDLAKAEKAIQDNPGIKMLYMETPANPTLMCVDIELLTQLAKKYGLVTAVDNTFATPCLQQPFRFGVDFTIHSVTKYLNGHGTGVGGVLVGRDVAWMETNAMRKHQLLGNCSNSFDAFLLNNGLKTLEIRMDRHCHNAMEVAHFLDAHPAVSKVNYLGLPTHPDYYTGIKQMSHPGAMLSFELAAGYEACASFLNKLKMCAHAVSLGTPDTLVCHPASTTHSYVSPEKRKQYGITDGLIRVSVGIENIMDIIADMEQALK